MKSQQQQFQQQQRQQQQRMQQGAAWMEEQKRQQQMEGQQFGQQPGKQTDHRFSEAEQEAVRLRQKYAAGKLSQGELEAKLRELMLQDASGTWWMVGTESGRWYRFDGKSWVPGTPLGRMTGGATPAANFGAGVSRGGSMVKAFFVLMLGIVISAGLFFIVGSSSYNMMNQTNADVAEPASYLFAALAGLIGLIVTIGKARQAARGD